MRWVVVALIATGAFGQQVPVPVARIADDAKVIDRVAEASKGDLPKDLLRRIINEDIELLRGHRADGTYAYASYERMEATRASESYSIEPSSDERLTKVDIRGEFAYRLTIGLPNRRMVVTKNRPLWIENAEIEYIPQGSSQTKTVNFPIKATMEAGETRNVDIPDIGRQVTAHVYVRAAKDGGYGNIVLTLIQAKVFDNADSPYADAVNSAKAIAKALDHSDVPSMRSMAARMQGDLHVPATPTTAGTSIDVSAVQPDVYAELQSIEDLLTGSDAERRAGLDKLHQLLRKLRK
ncbi:MAG TPA: hypothetical protein VII75_13065 [Thermoanaerobaculia bacterium]|nr:hypothetical protein [Thermoanaerobaculia bacterium]